LRLIGRVRAKDDFVTSIFAVVQQARRRKVFKAEYLSSLSVFLATALASEPVLTEIFNFAWRVKTDAELKNAAILLILVLFGRLPSQQRGADAFFQSRVYRHSGNDPKIERSAEAFLWFIHGDVSKAPLDRENPGLSYFGCKGSVSDAHSTFMKVFFAKSNFAVCPDIFADILAHLAALDIQNFERTVLPPFLSGVSPRGPRSSAMFRALNIINKPQFAQRASCKPTQSQIEGLNSAFIPIIGKVWPAMETAVAKQPKTWRIDTKPLLRESDEADSLISTFLSKNKISLFARPCSTSSPRTSSMSRRWQRWFRRCFGSSRAIRRCRCESRIS
jgi:hypothetical protein